MGRVLSACESCVILSFARAFAYSRRGHLHSQLPANMGSKADVRAGDGFARLVYRRVLAAADRDCMISGRSLAEPRTIAQADAGCLGIGR